MARIARRAFLGTGVGEAAFGIGDALSPVRRASGREKPAGKQVPGFYRFPVGTFELTVVTSGTLSFPIEDLWPETPRAEIQEVLAADFQPIDAPVLQVNALAVNTGDRLILIDTGSGGKFFATAGGLPASLAAAGIGLEHVDTVVFTHAHPDHLFGATDPSGTRLLYPNAEHVITDIEFDFWTAHDRVADLAEDWWRDMVQTAQGNLRAAAPRLRRIKPGAEVVPGIMSIDTAGQTSGRISLHIVSGRSCARATSSATGP
jgi:glyoxylase-like metal-dependent hydrolase (beta-lactamase superfamily II)